MGDPIPGRQSPTTRPSHGADAVQGGGTQAVAPDNLLRSLTRGPRSAALHCEVVAGTSDRLELGNRIDRSARSITEEPVAVVPSDRPTTDGTSRVAPVV